MAKTRFNHIGPYAHKGNLDKIIGEILDRLDTAEAAIDTAEAAIDAAEAAIGDLDDLDTTAKTSLVAAINEIKTS